MIIAAAITSLAAAQAWTFRTQNNLLRQPEAIAELQEAPGRYLRFSCSVLSGPVFDIALGARSFEEFAQYSASGEANAGQVALTVQLSQGTAFSVSAARDTAQVTSHAYTVGGAEAVTIAKAAIAAELISIASSEARADFALAGAKPAINQVLDACPFKG
jgi:hypothetical protein